MFQDMVAEHVSVLNKVTKNEFSVPITQTDTIANDDAQVLKIAAAGIAFQLQIDSSTSAQHFLVSFEVGMYFSSGKPSLDAFDIWCRTVYSDGVPLNVTTGTESDWFVFDRIDYLDVSLRYATLKGRMLVPNYKSEFEQYVQIAILNRSGEVMNGNATFKMRVYHTDYQFLQPMK